MKWYYILIGLVFLGCESRELNLSTGKATELYKDNEIISPQIIISREDRVSISSTAEMLTKNNNENALLSGNVVTNFFGEDGEHVSVLYSDTTSINENNNNFEAFGHVEVVSDSGLTLSTKRLVWDNRYKLVISKDSVRFTTSQGDTIYGVGFESDMDLTNWRIDKPTGVTNRWLKK